MRRSDKIRAEEFTFIRRAPPLKLHDKEHKSLVLRFRVYLICTIIWGLYTAVISVVALTNSHPLPGFSFINLGIFLLLTGSAKYGLNKFVDAKKKAETEEKV